MRILTTERLILRRFKHEDLDDFYGYAKNLMLVLVQDGSLMKQVGVLGDTKKLYKNKEVWAIVHKETGKVIGSIGLHNDERRNNSRVKMLGYALDEAWGKGLMTEAAKGL